MGLQAFQRSKEIEHDGPKTDKPIIMKLVCSKLHCSGLKGEAPSHEERRKSCTVLSAT